MYVVRWFQAYAGREMSSGKVAHSLQWEMSKIEGLRAAEWFPRGGKISNTPLEREYVGISPDGSVDSLRPRESTDSYREVFSAPSGTDLLYRWECGEGATLVREGVARRFRGHRVPRSRKTLNPNSESNINTDVGFIYKTTQVRRRFFGDVWSKPSRYSRGRALFATRCGVGKYIVGKAGTHNECFVEGAPSAVVVSSEMRPAEKRRVLYYARQAGLPVYQFEGVFNKDTLKRIA